MVRGDMQEQHGRTELHNSGSVLLRAAAFGPFRLRITERVLEKDGIPLKVGSRALDILIALVEAAPQVVTKRVLMKRVWGDLVVDEGSLRFTIASLRKTLGTTESGTTYVTSVSGRGYCFASLVTWTNLAPATKGGAGAAETTTDLPRRPLRILGRDGAIRDLTRRLRDQRFVSIVGAGGIGKTTVAVAIAHEVLSEFAGSIWFLELAVIHDPAHVGVALASQLGLSVVSNDPLPVIAAFLRGRRLLLVLDSCEHVIEEVANLAETIYHEAPHVHILATSREALRAEGEHVYHLAPLECPPADTQSLTATQALGFPAVLLFVKQVAATGYPFDLNDEDAPIVAEVCRRLDGIALALELAAGRVGVYGIRRTAALLDAEFRLFWRGRRTALPRHQTLNATLDWSYNLLLDAERLLLRRLGIFVGSFSLEAALGVVAENLDSAQVTEMLAVLVEKSLVTLDTSRSLRYRLLDTTRAYARQKLTESREHTRVARRHCEYICCRLERFNVRASLNAGPESVSFFVGYLGSVRAALEWAFSEQGDAQIALRLAATSAPLLLQLSLLTECLTWAERAIKSLNNGSLGTPSELEVWICFGWAGMNTRGNSPEAHSALVRALGLAEHLNDASSQLLLLHGLYRFAIRSGDFREIDELTGRFGAVAKQIDDPLADALSHGMLAITFSKIGNYGEASTHARIALNQPLGSSQLNAVMLAYVLRTGVLSNSARALWMLGFTEQAVETARQSLREAIEQDHPITTAYVLALLVFIYLQTADWPSAEDLIDRLMSHSCKHGLRTYRRSAAGWQGCLTILRDDPSVGIEQLQHALRDLHSDGYELYRGVFTGVLAEGLAKTGRAELARSTIQEAIVWAAAHGRSDDLPELQRIEGDILLAMSPPNSNAAEACFTKSLELARQQSALSLELRAGMRLARIWSENNRSQEALSLLGSLHGRFSEGFQTPDFIAASSLLQMLRAGP